MEIVPGIHRVDGTWGGNVYLLLDDHELTLIDAALPGNTGKIIRYIESLGRSPTELRHLILTHAHPDHTGTIPSLLDRADLRVLVHEKEVVREENGSLRLFYPGQLVSLPWNMPFIRKIFAHELIEEGQTLPILGGLKVLHTPGHTRGSISLYIEERKILFTGDNLIGFAKGFTRPFPFPGTDLKDYRRSVERLAELDFDVACVGHGKPVVGAAQKKLHDMLDNYFWASSWCKFLRRLSPIR